jgi:hypothetical protein
MNVLELSYHRNDFNTMSSLGDELSTPIKQCHMCGKIGQFCYQWNDGFHVESCMEESHRSTIWTTLEESRKQSNAVLGQWDDSRGCYIVVAVNVHENSYMYHPYGAAIVPNAAVASQIEKQVIALSTNKDKIQSDLDRFIHQRNTLNQTIEKQQKKLSTICFSQKMLEQCIDTIRSRCTFMFKKSEEDSVCTICFNDKLFSNIGKLSCGHTFHSKCIESWFNYQQNCPCCRGIVDVNSYYTGTYEV